MIKNTFNFKANLYLYNGGKDGGAWHFITLPSNVADEINFFYADQKRGWGSLPVEVTIGESTWSTSIFPQKETKSFFLPVKALVRKNENIADGDEVECKIKIRN